MGRIGLVSVAQVCVAIACGPSTTHGGSSDAAGASSSGPSSGSEGPAVPSWEGLELAYLADRVEVDGAPRWDLRLASADGRETMAISTTSVMSDHVAWSPGGDAVGYVAVAEVREQGEAPKPGIHVVDAEADREVARAGQDAAVRPPRTSTAVSWSPGGDRLAVTLPASSASFQCPPASEHALWVVRPREHTAAEIEMVSSDVDAGPGAWSGVDGRLSYSFRFRLCDDFGEEHAEPWTLWTWGDGEATTPLMMAYPGLEQSSSADSLWGLTWSADGRFLAVNEGGRVPDDAAARLRVIPASGAAAQVIDATPCAVVFAAWFPDGDRVIARRMCPGADPEHVAIDTANGAVVATLGDLGDAIAIAPDGVRIAYTGWRDGAWWVAVLDTLAGTSTWVAPGEGARWRPR